MLHPCPANGCSKAFGSTKALSAHITHCKFIPGTIRATAKSYANLDDDGRARKKQKTSMADDEEQDAEDIDIEVSHGLF